MLREPQCFKRRCKHFEDVNQPDGTELTEVNVCKAFPNGIPDKIAYGSNKHLKPIQGQGNEVVYAKG